MGKKHSRSPAWVRRYQRDSRKTRGQALDIKSYEPMTRSPTEGAISRVSLKIISAHIANMRSVSEVLESEGSRVQCKSGCAACCRTLVPTTFPEALVIASHVMDLFPPGRQEELDQKLETEIKELEQEDLTPLSHFLKQRPCVFLGPDELCSAYDVRPSVCRYHYVRSDPALCAPSASGDRPQIEHVPLSQAVGRVYEVSTNAWKKEFGGTPWVGPLPIMLWWALKLLREGPKSLTKALSDRTLVARNPVGWTIWSQQQALKTVATQKLQAAASPVTENPKD